MAAALSLGSRLLSVAIPTRAQALGSIFLSLLIMVVSHSQSLLHRIGISQDAITATQHEFHARFGALLQSTVASQLALVTFWATIGLIAYLICWGAYNAVVEARNEVTLTTGYTNRGHWRGPYETLALKTLAAVGLTLIASSLWFGLSFWLALVASVIQAPGLMTGLLAVAAVLGCAAQLYLLLMFVQLTFMPWYRAEAFTEA